MSNVSPVDVQLRSIRELVDKLVLQHRDFPAQIRVMKENLDDTEGLKSLEKQFENLQDTLTEHMLTEEFEIYPELMRRGLFDESTSMIMQQHHDLTASLGKMELALRIRSLPEFKAALGELTSVLEIHQPAEEEKIFPKVVWPETG